MPGSIAPSDRECHDFSDVDLIALAFGAFNVLRLASYFPQIAACCVGSARRYCNLLLLLVVVDVRNASTAFYAWQWLGYPGSALISAFNAACCLSGRSLAAWKLLVCLLLSINFATWGIIPPQWCKHGGWPHA